MGGWTNIAPIENVIFGDYLARELHSGVFWVISDFHDLSDYKLLVFEIPCDVNGKPVGTHSIELNSKSGSTYNHKKLWKDTIVGNSAHKPYNRKSYDYYPRGRVEISNDRAIIYLNPNIDKPFIINEIKNSFGLILENISEIRIIADGSNHYKCWMD